eukprot:COSAG01_NODE_52946_length_342_cov_8.045267_1_plen_90_part_10
MLSFDEFLQGMRLLNPAQFGRARASADGSVDGGDAPPHHSASARRQLDRCRTLFAAIDADSSGALQIDEWLAAALHCHVFGLRHAASEAF